MWQQAGREATDAADAAKDAADAVKDTSDAAEEAAEAITKSAKGFREILIINNQISGTQKVAATAQSAAGRALHTQSNLWHSMARDAKDFSSHIFSATRSLLRWASLTGLISGVLGGGGLFGIERLAASAGGARRSALGLGVSPGEERAFGVNYSRITDPGQFLSGINAAKIDVGSDQFLALKALGIDGRKIQEEKTGDLAVETIQQLKKFVDKTPDGLFFGPTMNTMHADKLMSIDDLQRLKRTPAAEIEDYAKHYRADRQTLDLTEDQQKAWQDLQVQLHRAGESIENVFVKGLTPLAPAIERLSEAFTKAVGDLLSRPELKEWIDELAEGIKTFAGYIGSDSFKSDAGEFVKNVKDFAMSTGEALKTIKSWLDWFNGPDKTYDKTGPGGAPGLSENGETDNPGGGSDERAPWVDKFNKWWKNHSGGSAEAATPGFVPMSFNPGDPRGIRNNNPLNISYVPGQGAAGSDGHFGVYRSQEEGIAASTRQLLLYQDRDHLNTIKDIVSKWAPPSENDTGSYIAGVSKQTGIGANDRVNLHDPKTAAAIVAAMAKHENGRNLDPETVRRGVDMGLGRPLAPSGNARPTVNINVNNNTGGNATVSANQLVAT